MNERLSESQPIPEARPPHLPDVLTRLSPGVFAFGLVELIVAWAQVRRWTNDFPFPDGYALFLFVGSLIPSVAVPLLGVALFVRHPRAHRTMPLLVFGLALMAVGGLLDTFGQPIRDFLAGLEPNEVGPWTPAQTAYTVFTTLLVLFALLYVGAGLSLARQRERVAAERPILIWLVALAVVIVVLSATAIARMPVELTTEVVIQLGLGLVLSLLVTLGWTYVTAVAIGGWLAGEGPRRAWGLAALGLLILFVVQSFGSVVTVLAIPDASNAALVITARRVVGRLAAADRGLPAGAARRSSYGRSTGSDADRFRSRLRPSSTCSVDAYGPGIRKHGRPAMATPGN